MRRVSASRTHRGVELGALIQTTHTWPDPATRAERLAPPLQGYPVEMAPWRGSRESLVHRALPVYLGLLFAILTVVAVVVLFMVRHVLLVLFVSVLFAAALTGPSEWIHRRFRLPLGLAALLIYIACFALLVGIGWIVVPLFSARWWSSPIARRNTPTATRASVKRTPSFEPTSLRCRRSSAAVAARRRDPRRCGRAGGRASGRRLLDLHRPARGVFRLAAPPDESAADP